MHFASSLFNLFSAFSAFINISHDYGIFNFYATFYNFKRFFFSPLMFRFSFSSPCYSLDPCFVMQNVKYFESLRKPQGEKFHAMAIDINGFQGFVYSALGEQLLIIHGQGTQRKRDDIVQYFNIHLCMGIEQVESSLCYSCMQALMNVTEEKKWLKICYNTHTLQTIECKHSRREYKSFWVWKR